MRLGCCGSLEHADIIQKAGFDFLEVNVQVVLKGDEPQDVWDAQAPNVRKLSLPVEAANCLIPASHPIVGPHRDLQVLRMYMQRVAQRAERLGIKRFVFGSGGARNRPAEVSQQEATEHLVEFCTMAAQVCNNHGVIVVVEHLNQGETNTINKLDDARAICEAVGHPNLMALVDTYHYGLEHESEQAVLDLGSMVRHVHLAEPDGRFEPGSPKSPENAFDFADFFCLLRKIGFNEGISIESSWSKPVEERGPEVVRMLRDTWAAAGRCES